MTDTQTAWELRQREAEEKARQKAKDEQKRADDILARRSGLNRKTDAVRAVLQQTDRIITGRGNLDVRMTWPESGLENNPAWTDGETVFLNKKLAEQMLENPRLDFGDFVLIYKGTNYHEVAHILFSPRASDALPGLVQQDVRTDNSFVPWHAYMILEDQRIETLYTSTYPPTTIYFVHSGLNWLCSDTANLAGAWPLVAGRLFLPLKVRMACREAFVVRHGETLAKKVQQIVDKYVVLNSVKDAIPAHTLVRQMQKVLDQMGAHMGSGMPNSGCGDNHQNGAPSNSRNDNVVSRGRAFQKDIKEATEEAQEVLDQDKKDRAQWAKDEAKKAKSDDADSDDGESEDGEGEDSGKSEAGSMGTRGGDGTGDGAGNSSGEGGMSDEPSGEGQGGTGAGAGRDGEMPEIPKSDIGYDPTELQEMLEDLQEAASEALNDVKNDQQLKQDVTNTSKSIRAALNSEGDTSGKYGKHQSHDAPQNVVATSRKVQKVIQAMKFDLEPTWNRQQFNGRLNSQRVIRRRGDRSILDVFDSYDEGIEEEAAMEVVVLVDLSASMAHHMRPVSEALWALKRAYDKCDIRVTCIGFSDGHVLLYKPSEKVQPATVRYYGTYGGTNPTSALKQAHAILSRSNKPNRLLVAITDGIWQGERNDQSSVMRNLQRAGVQTLLIGMGAFDPNYIGHIKFDSKFKATTAEDMADAIKESVKGFLRRLQRTQ